MKTRIIIGLALLTSATILLAQKEEESYLDRPRNNVYFNFIGGDGSVISTNYERMFLLRSKFFLEGGLGIGYNKLDDIADSNGDPDLQFKYLTIPHHITINLGKVKSFFEIGLGGTGIIGDVNQNYYLYPIIGYRYHSYGSYKPNFRVYIGYPFYGRENMDIWWIPVGLSLGVVF